MGTLTVRENLHFSAALRLPGRLSKREREERVDATLSDLGLFHVAESKVRLASSFTYKHAGFLWGIESRPLLILANTRKSHDRRNLYKTRIHYNDENYYLLDGEGGQ